MNIFFTSDLHFDHANVRLYNNRPWNSLEEMNEGIIENYNSKVGKKDLTYIIGDFAFQRHGYFLNRLNGKKILILGSHDKMPEKYLKSFTEVHQAKGIIIDKQFIYMSHCCMRVWERSHYFSAHFFGHSHGRLKTYNLSFDVGIDANDYFPQSFEEMNQKIKIRLQEMEICGRIVIENGNKICRQDDLSYFMNLNKLSQ